MPPCRLHPYPPPWPVPNRRENADVQDSRDGRLALYPRGCRHNLRVFPERLVSRGKMFRAQAGKSGGIPGVFDVREGVDRAERTGAERRCGSGRFLC